MARNQRTVFSTRLTLTFSSGCIRFARQIISDVHVSAAGGGVEPRDARGT